MPRLSIIIASYNMAAKLRRCLRSIYVGEVDEREFEVIVADSSTDGSPVVLASFVDYYTNLRVIRSKERLLAGQARNLAVRKARGEYVYMLDADDRLCSKDTLAKILASLDGRDVYYCPWRSVKNGIVVSPVICSLGDMARASTGPFAKMYRRDLYVDFAPYMPEAVAAHYLLLDRAKTFGAFDFAVTEWDDGEKNVGAISRTFDAMRADAHDLGALACTDALERRGLRAEYVEGVIRSLADMFALRSKLANPDVRAAWSERMRYTARLFEAGYFIH